MLTRAGVETENIETRGGKIEQVIVSQIVASSRHPNADRLTVCEVDDGSGTKRQIVCGATNYKVGDKVPLALPGANLPNGLEIRKSKLRGVESEGMLCSPIELGLGRRRIRAFDFDRLMQKLARRFRIFSRATPFSMSKSHRTVAIC